ncbi:MAG: gamma-glutamyltransferase family protein [Actinomycetota bacterium]
MLVCTVGIASPTQARDDSHRIAFAPPVTLEGHCGGEPMIADDHRGSVFVSTEATMEGGEFSRHGDRAPHVCTTWNEGSPFWRSEDGGASFLPRQGVGPLGWADTAIAADPLSGDVYFAEMQIPGIDVCRSTDHGATWTTAVTGMESCTQPLNLTGEVIANDRPYLDVFGPTAQFPHRDVYLSFRDLATFTTFPAVNAVYLSRDGSPFRPLPGPSSNTTYLGDTVDSGFTFPRPRVDSQGDLYFLFATGSQSDPHRQSNVWVGRLHHPGRDDQGWSLTKILDRSAAGAHLENAGLAIDSADNLYVVLSGNIDGPEARANAYLWSSTDHGTTWIGPTQLNADKGLRAMATIAAGGPGQVLVGWYRSETGTLHTDEDTAWTYDVARISGAASAGPYIDREVVVSSGIAHQGPICGGPSQTVCATGRNSLIDFTTGTVDARGCGLFAYTDDHAIVADNSNWAPELIDVAVARQTKGCFGVDPRTGARGQALTIGPVSAETASDALSPIGSEQDVSGRAIDCDPRLDHGCLPTPIECASGNYNGHWDGGYAGRFADCLGGLGHVAHYVGGYLGDDSYGPCGAIIEDDEVVVTNTGWGDPNVCPPTSADPLSVPVGTAVPGRALTPLVSSSGGVVASASEIASNVGLSILRHGGNAIDAAVATTFAIGVTEPSEADLSANGFLVYRSKTGQTDSLDFEGVVPKAVHRDTFTGEGIWRQGTGHEVVAVPGVPAAMAAALDRYGTMSLAQVIAPAEELAAEGFPVSTQFSTSYGNETLAGTPDNPWRYESHAQRLKMFPASAKVYLRNGVAQYPPDNPWASSTLVSKDYARSLALIARYGTDAFYRDGSYPAFDYNGRHYEAGPSIARLIVDDMQASNSSPYPGDAGLMTMDDLSSYRAIWRKPIEGTYRGSHIFTIGAPALGGTFEIETLNIMEGYDLRSIGHSTADYWHYFAEAQKLAWADGTAYIGDPALFDPPSFLLSKGYAAQRRQLIDRNSAKCYAPGSPTDPGSVCPETDPPLGHTSHLSVIDGEGNAVSLTFSVSHGFGSAVVAPGTGFVLNSNVSEDAYGAEGSPGEVLGGRRIALTPQTPTIVVKNGKPIFVGGAAGGSWIPMSVVLAISNVVDFGLPLNRAIDAARLQEFTCCDMSLEDGRVRPEVLTELQERGHVILGGGEYASAQLEVVGIDPVTGLRVGGSDPRWMQGTLAE